ncbi:MAG: 23S rRNA (pseudouridine(1915)-N(3))-methyltransferase RlmH [Myxococcales bacterium]|nr:23S rRNA (pseudouridine(1915)-N(3))-methyltransferase RlmH [Myxococcales bacterium]
MKVALITVGRTRAAYFDDASAEYAKRIGRYATLTEHVVRDVRGQPLDVARRRESEAILDAAPRGATIVALDERGELVTSAQLARKLERAALAGDSAWALCIGGADGHDEVLRSRATWTWALSTLTLPHELARVVVLEQLYRAFTIIRGEAYHRA